MAALPMLNRLKRPTTASLAFLASSALIGVIGCSPSPDTEISAQKSKYQAAGDDSAGNKGAETPTALSGGGTPSKTASAPPAGTTSDKPSNEAMPRPNPNGNNASIPPLPTTPAADSRSFMVLKPTMSKDPKELMKYLETADNAFRELLLGMQARQVNQEVVMDRGAAIGKMKLDAAEKLAASAQDEEQKDVSVFARIEALSQLAGFGDASSARTLEGFAKEISTIKNPKMAHQASLVLFSFRVSEYDSGQMKTAAPLLEEMDRLLEKKELLSVPDFRMMGQTLGVIQKQGDKEAFELARNKIADAFESNEDPRLVMEAWRLKVTGSPQEAALNDSLQNSVDKPDSKENVATLKSAVDDMIKTFPSATTLLVLGSYAMQVEASGATDAAMLMIDAVKAKVDTVKSPEFKADLDRMISDASKRFNLLGKPVDLTKLTDLKGAPLDVGGLAGKVVLIDVWATWCRPCVESFPELKEVYAANKEKGFEIVGVNIDDETAAVETFQSKTPLPWLIARSTDANDKEAIGFRVPFAQQLGVTAIPMMVLLDKKGNAVAMHLRGERLLGKVKELLAAP